MTDPSCSSAESECELALVLDQLNERIQAGDFADLDAEIAKFPAFAQELRTLLPAMQLMCDWAVSVAASGSSASTSTVVPDT